MGEKGIAHRATRGCRPMTTVRGTGETDMTSEDPEVQAGLAVAAHTERTFHHALRELAE